MVNPLSILISKSEYNTFITFITKCFYKDLSARVRNHYKTVQHIIKTPTIADQ